MKLKEMIKKIEKIRQSRVIVYFTSDRPNLGEMILEDVIEIFHDILVDFESDNVDLVIYSRGGHTIVPLHLVKLIRKFCKKFSVLVPFRAHSAATMIALGADEIYMTKLAELGPVDTQLTFLTEQNKHLRLSVVDIFAYLEFTKKHTGIDYRKTSDGIQILNNFHQFSNLTPVNIAVLYRSYKQAFEYARELAKMHYTEKEITPLCESLITQYGSHDYKIDSHEAKELGMNILDHDKNLDSLLNELYVKIASIMELKNPFILSQNIGDTQVGIRGIIASSKSCYAKLQIAEIEESEIIPPATKAFPAPKQEIKPWEIHNEYLNK